MHGLWPWKGKCWMNSMTTDKRSKDMRLAVEQEYGNIGTMVGLLKLEHGRRDHQVWGERS